MQILMASSPRTLWDESTRPAQPGRPAPAPASPEAMPAAREAGQTPRPTLTLRTLWDGQEKPAPAEPAPEKPSPEQGAPKNKGGRPKGVKAPANRLGTATPAWLFHHLTVSGPAADVAGFGKAARGPGVVLWRIDGDALEEDLFHLAASQPPATRSLGIEGCRILARQFRSRVEARRAKAAALASHGRGCPFDLNVLLPVPDEVLRLGSSHPKALDWLRRNWGVTDLPRRMEQRPRATAGKRLPAGHAVLGYAFFTVAGEVPHAGLERLAESRPALRFALRPRHLD